MTDDDAPVPPIRVVIADDVALWREGIARLLADAGIDVVAQAEDVESFTVAVDRERPDVAIVDVRMPPTFTDDGLRAAVWARRSLDGVGVLVLCQSVYSGPPVELLGIGSGGVGYLLKERVANTGQLVEAVRTVAEGGSVIDPLVSERLLSRRGGPGDPLEELSARERQVLRLLAEGASNQGIAEQLVVSIKTVEAHVHSLLLKLGIEQDRSDNSRVLAVLTYLRVSGDAALDAPA